MIKRRAKVDRGSENVFADLGLPDAEEMLLKSTIVIELRRLIRQRKLAQTAAAKLIGINQGDLSRILRGSISWILRGQTYAHADCLWPRRSDHHQASPKIR